MDELTQELDELSHQYAGLDSEHQKTLLELAKYKETLVYGATFKFENDNEFFMPILANPTGLKSDGRRPISYSLNFNESTMVEWIYNLDMSLQKNKKQEPINNKEPVT